MRWTALLPLAAADHAKSRLRPASATAPDHAALVEALRRDTARALVASTRTARVLVVSPDPAALAWAEDQGFIALAETGATDPNAAPNPDLNAALAQADAVARLRWPADPVYAIVADLPALTGPALDEVLAGFGTEPGRGFVTDRAGTGTTMLATLGLRLDPRFGPGSARRHRDSGARELVGSAEVRWDIDTVEDLAQLRPWLPADSATARVAR